MAKEGIYETHIPRPNLNAVLQNMDEEYAKQHPIIRDILQKPSEAAFLKEKRSKKRARFAEKSKDAKIESKEEKVDPKPHSEKKTATFRHITDEEIEQNRLSEEELASLKAVSNNHPF